MSPAAPGLDILLVEPNFVLRRTIVAVAHDLGVARMQEATSVDVAASLLAARPFDGLVLAVSAADGPAAFKLLSRLRQGSLRCDANIPVAALTDGPPEAVRAQLEPFRPVATIGKPFKVAALLQVLQQMAPALA